MNKQISFIVVLALLLQLFGFTGTVYASRVDYITCSDGASTLNAGSATGTVIDSNIVLTGDDTISGAKVYVTDGFNAATDELVFVDTPSISGIYTSGTGTLTLTGNATPADYQTALRSVRIKTSLSGSGTRKVVFSLGNKIEFNGHYYEYVSVAPGTITWTDARDEAATRTYYGASGYLAAITSQEENDFLLHKIAQDAWIGASDTTTEGAWYWVTGPVEDRILFSTGFPATTYAGVYSNWADNQPDNFHGAENYGELCCTGSNAGKWNDLENTATISGYLVEYTPLLSTSSSKTVNITAAPILSYSGNGSDGGSVPAGATAYAIGSSVNVVGNSGDLTKAGKGFGGWNTATDGSGTAYYPGDVFTISANTTLYAIWSDEATIDCSTGTSSFTVGSTGGTTVDGSLTVADGAMITGAKAYIMAGFDSANDLLSFTPTVNITGTYDDAKGTLTLTGTATSAEYQTALRSVTFKTSSTAVGTKTVNFALGNKIEYDGHYYEYVNNGANITWTAAKAAAESRIFYGQQGYLATITNEQENDFVAEKISADAWIGATDATTEGAWHWVTGPENNTQFSEGNAPGTTAVSGRYNNWNANEPNDSGGAEDYAMIFCSGVNPGKWNDLANTGSITGYLVEYTAATGASDSKNISIIAQSSSSGGRGSSSQESGVNVIVNGQVQNAGKQTESIQDGVKTTEVDVDETILSAKIDSAITSKQSGQNEENMIEVPVSSDAENIKVAMTGDIVKKMDDNGFTLNVSFRNVSYLIPAEEINISELATQLGAGSLADIELKVEFQSPDPAALAKITEAAQAKEYEIVIPPLNFEVIAVNTKINQQTNITKFSNYVERIFEIPANIDPEKVTTGIVCHADGTFSHIPTVVVKIGDKYFAKLNSLTNSTYSVIWNPVAFDDMVNHWAKEAANNMGSRLIVNGVGDRKFEPNRAITRGEFAAIITKALGIFRNGVGTDQFSDVKKANIFYDAISIADENDLITGYPNGLYKADKTISREEAMVILTRAADIVKLNSSSGKTMNGFTDQEQVSGWARDAVEVCIEKGIIVGSNGMIQPKSNISRAEVVTVIERLLTETQLINE